MQNEENNSQLAYWLSNVSTLLFLLQQNLKASRGGGSVPFPKPPPPTSLFGRMTQVCGGYNYCPLSFLLDKLCTL